MSVQPVTPPHRLLTVDEYLEIGEVEPGYTELLEGRLLMSPSPTFRRGRANGKLRAAVDAQLPPGLVSVMGIDVDLQLGPPRDRERCGDPTSSSGAARLRRGWTARVAWCGRPRCCWPWRSCRPARDAWTTC
jgi:hypothetical protein